MQEIYLFFVVILFILAISDLIVGVSNDAVNFLNSAIGARVASRRTIMIVASVGILIGTTFSSGMMEVARKGVFNPEFFFFGEVMVIFLAVMLTDIILLDFFNTIGLPTSTTVSIVFELLGAAVVVSLIKIAGQAEGVGMLSKYINSSQALLIISGIFLSVLFAFIIGALVQYISRLIFTFHYHKKKQYITALWAGLAMTAMFYFLLLKGLKGASFTSEGFLLWVKGKMLLLLGLSFVIWTGVFVVLSRWKVDAFRVVVLFGTFSLAMAFAGNDLVNFIGVPIAGFESYLAWSGSGAEAFSYTMESLQRPVQTNSLLLLIAGAIMTITLWFSRKARTVTDTEVSLGRQDEGHERFHPSILARGIVRGGIISNQLFSRILPKQWSSKLEKSFLPPGEEQHEEKPAFDLVRASVNLTTASVLIAFATSLKLPLSTTYVSFMVAMGTSLADRAWGRDSAVYRVAGVLNVIGGWLATALIAFVVAGIFAFLIFYFQLTAVLILIGLATIFIYRSFSYHKIQDKKNQKRIAFESEKERIAVEKLIRKLSTRINDLFHVINNTLDTAFGALLNEDRQRLYQTHQAITSLIEKNEDLQYELFRSIKRIQEESSNGSRLILYVYDLEQDIVQSVGLVEKSIRNHLENYLSPLKPIQKSWLHNLNRDIMEYLSDVAAFVADPESGNTESLFTNKKRILQKLEEAIAMQVEGVKNKEFGKRNSLLMFKLLLESKDIVAVAGRYAKLYRRIFLRPQKKLYYSFGLGVEDIK